MSWLFGSNKTKVVAESSDEAEYVHKPITEADFDAFIALCDEFHEEWTTAFEDKKKELCVYTKKAQYIHLKTDASPINMVKARKMFHDFGPEVLYDVLHDHEYRTEWDDSMLEGYIIKEIDSHSAIGYYGAKMPAPLTNRDFVNLRAWTVRRKADPPVWVICNHSVHYPGHGEKSGYVRGWSFRTGYLIRKLPEGTQFTYCTLADPKGWIPTWVLNMAVSTLGPRLINKLGEVTPGYPEWCKKHRPDGLKPWETPDNSPRKEKDADTSDADETKDNGSKKEKRKEKDPDANETSEKKENGSKKERKKKK